MYQEVLPRQFEHEVERDRVSSLVEAAETITENAIDEAREKMGFYEQEAALEILLKRKDFSEYFKYALAQEVAQVLGAYDQLVESVYLFEESDNPDDDRLAEEPDPPGPAGG